MSLFLINLRCDKRHRNAVKQALRKLSAIKVWLPEQASFEMRGACALYTKYHNILKSSMFTAKRKRAQKTPNGQVYAAAFLNKK